MRFKRKPTWKAPSRRRMYEAEGDEPVEAEVQYRDDDDEETLDAIEMEIDNPEGDLTEADEEDLEDDEEDLDESDDGDSDEDEEDLDENIENFGDKKAAPFKKKNETDDSDDDDDELDEADDSDDELDEDDDSDDELDEDDEEESEEDDDEIKESKAALGSRDLHNMMEALGISKSKMRDVKIIVEAHINSGVSHARRLERNRYNKRLKLESKKNLRATIKGIDRYLDERVNEWINENKPEVVTQIRGHMAESFVSKARELFLEFNIEIPKGKSNAFKELTEMYAKTKKRNTLLESKLSTVDSELVEYQRDLVIEKFTDNLSSNQKTKFIKLVESVDARDENDLIEKCKTFHNVVVSENKKSFPNPRRKLYQKRNMNENSLFENNEDLNKPQDQMNIYVEELNS